MIMNTFTSRAERKALATWSCLSMAPCAALRQVSKVFHRHEVGGGHSKGHDGLPALYKNHAQDTLLSIDMLGDFG